MLSRLALNFWAQEILQVSDDPSQLEVFSMQSEVEPSSGYMWRLQFICTMLRLGHLGEHIPARLARLSWNLSSFSRKLPCASV